ncbi:MAG: YceD family protein [Actinomycetes bacterium]
MRIPVTDLVGRPGSTRDVVESVVRADVGTDPWGPAEEGLRDPLHLDLQLDAVVEGIFVHGTVGFTVELTCARCLEPVEVEREVDVAELFQDPAKLDPEDELEEGYALVADRSALDLERMLHDVVILGLPVRVTCDRPECVPYASDDVALVTEDEHVEQLEGRPDPRWARLAELDLPHDTPGDDG